MMRKILIAIMMMLLAAGSVSRLDAAERNGPVFGIGANVWCAWWKPMWADRPSVLPFTSSFKMNNPRAIGGPLLNVVINERWAISTGFNYGRFKGEAATFFPGMVLTLLYGLPPFPLGITRNAQRYDFDFIISNGLNKYLKIFWGIKYWGYDLKIRQNLFIISLDSNETAHSVGPGLGLVVNIPLMENLNLQPAISALVQYSVLRSKQSGPVSLLGRIISPGGFSGDMLYYGLNATLTLGYHIAKIHTTMAIGGRIQYMMIEPLSVNASKNYSDLFGGLTFAVIYIFNMQSSAGGQGKK